MAVHSTRNDSELVENVVKLWFGSTKFSRYDTMESQKELWWGGSKKIDDDIRNRFGTDVERALNGDLDHLINHDEHGVRGDLALTIILDQFPRNIYRGSAKAFVGDAKSREIVMSLLEPSRWQVAKDSLPCMIRFSFMLPLMHQESVSDLDRCINEIQKMTDELKLGGEQAAECVKIFQQSRDFAEKHRDIIQRFGRFPHRNEVLDRESTDEEIEYLKSADRFGQ